MANQLLEEHEAMLEVYEARIARAKIVRSRFAHERLVLQKEQDWVEERVRLLEKEFAEAPQVEQQYWDKLRTGRTIVRDLREGRGVTTDSGVRKEPSRVEKAKSLQAKLTKMLREDPSLAEVMREALQQQGG